MYYHTRACLSLAAVNVRRYTRTIPMLSSHLHAHLLDIVIQTHMSALTVPICAHYYTSSTSATTPVLSSCVYLPSFLCFLLFVSVFQPQTPSGLVACLDDHGAGAFPSAAASPVVVRRTLPPPAQVITPPRYYTSSFSTPQPTRYYVSSNGDQEKFGGTTSLRTPQPQNVRYVPQYEVPRPGPPSAAPPYFMPRDSYTNNNDASTERFYSTPAFPIPLPEMDPGDFALPSRQEQPPRTPPSPPVNFYPSSVLLSKQNALA